MNGDFLERMVALANYVGNELGALPDDDARYEMVVEIVESAEIVFAVWQDRSARDGVGYTMVKGQAIARQAVAVKGLFLRALPPFPVRTQSRLKRCCKSLANAVPCTSGRTVNANTGREALIGPALSSHGNSPTM